MTKHPITPPPELIEDWIEIAKPLPHLPPNPGEFATLAARWGADQELEACCSGMNDWGDIHNSAGWELSQDLRSARRPKPQTLNSIALQMLATIERDAHYLPEITDTIRQALESLSE